VLTFEWDARKASGNLRKHGVAFQEAATGFADPLSLTVRDPEHSGEEDWFVLLGTSYLARVLVVVHTECGDSTRIISARLATAAERRVYEEG
jgi:uncharacterized DUF497 family protein